MGNYEQLKQSVSDVIKTNGNQEITGSILQNVLLTIISSVGANATFAGIATPTTNPGTPDGPVFYLASENGTYTNFNAIELQDGLSALMWNGSWSSQQILSIDDVPTAESNNLINSGGVFSSINKETTRATTAETEISDSVERYGYGISSNGLITKDTDFILSPFILIPDGCETLEWGTGGALNTSEFSGRPLWLCLYDENKKILPDQEWFPNSKVRNITLHENAKYVRFPVYHKNVQKAYVKNEEYSVYYDFNGYAYANEIKADLETETIRAAEISDSVERYGYGTNISGMLSDSDFSLSPMIAIPEGCTSLTWGTGGILDPAVYSRRCCYLTEYDEEKNLISDGAWFPNSKVRNITLNENTKYVRFPVLNKNIGSAYIENDEFNLFWSFNYNKKLESELRDDIFNFGYGMSVNGKIVKDKDFILSPMIEIPENCTSIAWNIGNVLDSNKYLNAFLCEFDAEKQFISSGAWYPNREKRTINFEGGENTRYVRFPIFNSNIGDSYIENKEYNIYCGFGTPVKENNYYDNTYYYLRNLNKTKIDENTGSSDTTYKPLVLLNFADIHNDASNLQRIVEFSIKYKTYLSDVFLNGDIAGGNWNQFSEKFNKILVNNKILCSIGNHDIYKYNNTSENATAKQCYDRYFSNIAQWGVIEPSDNTNIGKCYYYKDYTSSGIRFIVLDCMHYNTEQNDWLKSVLTSAITSNLSVIIAQHIAIKGPTSNGIEAYNVPFNSIDHQDAEASNGGQFEAVKEFIANGGEFVTWLFGHTHSDFCGKIKDTTQNYIVVGAAQFNANWNDTIRNSDDYSIDLFNIISVDTKSKTISIKRVGANYDRFLRRRNAMCINYKECSVISFN